MPVGTYHCTTCGAAWSEGAFTADCLECGGGAMEHPCLACGGRCGARWQRAVHDSWDYRLSHWAGRCALPEEEQRPYDHAVAYSFLVQGFLDDVYSLERFERLYKEHLKTPGMQPEAMRPDIRAAVEALFARVVAAAEDERAGHEGEANLRTACGDTLRRFQRIIDEHRRGV